MNMQNLMAQAQKIQKEIQKKQEEINSTLFTGTTQYVTVQMYGSKKLHKITINHDLLHNDEDIDAIEDMLMIAFNDAMSQIDKEIENKMGAYGKGLNGLL